MVTERRKSLATQGVDTETQFFSLQTTSWYSVRQREQRLRGHSRGRSLVDQPHLLASRVHPVSGCLLSLRHVPD